MYVAVHSGDQFKGISAVGAFHQSALFHADEEGIGIIGVEIYVLGMGYVGRCWERPLGHVDRPELGELRPVVAQVVAVK